MLPLQHGKAFFEFCFFSVKSLILEELNRIEGSSYHLGSSSTKAGLAQFLFDTRPRILLIDELDKMSHRDYAIKSASTSKSSRGPCSPLQDTG